MTTDLVLDVMRAAEPQKLAAASQRLSGGGGSNVRPWQPPARRSRAAPGRAAKAHQQFESAMLRTFTEQMMPKDTSSLYGEGTAADIWRSLAGRPDEPADRQVRRHRHRQDAGQAFRHDLAHGGEHSA